MTRLMDKHQKVVRSAERGCIHNDVHTTPFHRHLYADVFEAIDMIRARNDLPRGDVVAV